MENRPLFLVAGLTMAVFAALPMAESLAQETAAAGPTPAQRADWEQRLAHASELAEKGQALKSEAKERFEARKKECLRKFRVNACEYDAKQDYVQATHEARRIENDGKALERQVRKEQLAGEDARRLADAPRRAAELEAREAAARAERGRDEEARAEKLAEKEAQARAGAERRAAAEERLRKKQEKHDRKVAEKMAKNRQREAEAGH